MSSLSQGIKYDGNKPRMDLLSYPALLEVAKVAELGAKKYEEWNWAKGLTYSRVISAAERHIGAFKSGEDNDPEWGLSHIAHAMNCLMYLLHYELYEQYEKFDDRPNFKELGK